ncbi:MAG: hypothetical protein GY753_09855 [Gammaproteobacteria bacterium]|nr:hypothetical protein [Gammaproteobacteria bacterium]
MPPIMESMSVRELVVLVVIAVAGGGGAGFGYSKADDPRPDPFTGAQGDALAAEVAKLKLDVRQNEHDINGMKLDLGKESRATGPLRELQYRMNSIESAMRTHKNDRDGRDHVRTMP